MDGLHSVSLCGVLLSAALSAGVSDGFRVGVSTPRSQCAETGC